jgi:excisionase family DNA binding protein
MLTSIAVNSSANSGESPNGDRANTISELVHALNIIGSPRSAHIHRGILNDSRSVIELSCAVVRNKRNRLRSLGRQIRNSRFRIVADATASVNGGRGRSSAEERVFPTRCERHCHCGTHPANSCHRMPSTAKPFDQASSAAEGYLTTTDTLAYLRTTPRTLYRHLAAGNIPAVRIGHQWRFKRDDLDRWLAARATRPRETGAVAAPVTRRVLIVDDEPEICGYLERILSVTDLEVETTCDGPSALERIRRTPYDVLFTDLMMPRLDGNQLLRAAKSVRPDLKVIIVTGYPTQSSAIDAINVGVDGYLIKPFQPADVLAAAARAVGVPHDQLSTRTAE